MGGRARLSRAVSAWSRSALPRARRSRRDGQHVLQGARGDERIYVFNNPDNAARFRRPGSWASHHPRGQADGETVVADSERALELSSSSTASRTRPARCPEATAPAWSIHGLVFGDYSGSPSTTTRSGTASRASGSGGPISPRPQVGPRVLDRLRLETTVTASSKEGTSSPRQGCLSHVGVHGGQLLRGGIQPFLAFDAEEQFGDYGMSRSPRRSLLDRLVARLRPVRERAGVAAGPGLRRPLRYYSGHGSETDKYKIIRLRALHDCNPGLHAEASTATGVPGRHGPEDGQGLAAWSGKAFRSRGLSLAAARVGNDGRAGPRDPDLVGLRRADALPKKLTLFARWHDVSARMGDGDFELGVPGADSIDYLPISVDAPVQARISWPEWYLLPQVRISPNVEWVRDGTAPSGLKIEDDGRAPDHLLRQLVVSAEPGEEGGGRELGFRGAVHALRCPGARGSTRSRTRRAALAWWRDRYCRSRPSLEW